MTDKIRQSEKKLAELRELMDSMSIKGEIVSQGWFRSPLFIQGTPPPEHLLHAYQLELINKCRLEVDYQISLINK